MLTSSQQSTVISLQGYLSRIAYKLHNTHWSQVPAEDIAQEMNLHIAERAEADPTFLDQTPGYITRAAAWHARHWCRDTFTRVHHGQRVGRGVPLETDEEGDRPADEVYAAEAPDTDLAIAVQDALAGLDESARRVAQLKMAGLQRVEIARELGTSSQNLTQYLRRIEAVLAPVWQAVVG